MHCASSADQIRGLRSSHVEPAIDGANTGNTSTCGDGKSNRAISRELGVDRGTVARTLSQFQNQPPVWEAPTGSADDLAGTAASNPGDEISTADSANVDANATSVISTTDISSTTQHDETTAASPSECDVHREEIIRKLEKGLTAPRI